MLLDALTTGTVGFDEFRNDCAVSHSLIRQRPLEKSRERLADALQTST
jgi:hypothetical protein